MKFRISIFLFFISVSVFAQTSFQQRYSNAKQLFLDGKYSLATEVFKELIPYDAQNPFSEYASFYYALSAYKQGYNTVARDMFMQIKSIYPDWDKIQEVSYWLAVIHFENHEYFQALLQLSTVDNRDIKKDGNILKQFYLSEEKDLGTLRSLYDKNPEDEIVAEAYARRLSEDIDNPESVARLQLVMRKFNLNEKDFVVASPKTIKKDVYTVAVLLPFMSSEFKSGKNPGNNFYFYNLWEGMRMAADTLSKQGIKIELRAYDTKRNIDTLRKLLTSEELRSADLLVGPLYPDEILQAQKFSYETKTNMFNPYSSQNEIIRDNPYAFLFQPGIEIVGSKCATFLDQHITGKKRTMIVYETGKRDSVIVANFLESAKNTSLDIISMIGVTGETSKRINDTLAHATEFDENKAPTQFTLAKDSIDCIFVASENPLIFTKVVSSVESRGDSTIVLGLEGMLDGDLTKYQKYENLHVAIASPNYIPLNDPWLNRFMVQYTRIHGKLPKEDKGTETPYDFATLGYRFMIFAGNILHDHGVYFQDEIRREAKTPYLLGEGYDYTHSNDNQVLPIIGFENGEMVLIKRM